MGKRILAILIVGLLLVSGCSLVYPEIKTDIPRCKESADSVLGAVGIKVVEEVCKNKCQAEGFSFRQWKCSKENTFTCVCNR